MVKKGPGRFFASLTALLVIAAALPLAQQTGTALISGQVIDAGTGRPIADATVTMNVPQQGRGAGPAGRGGLNATTGDLAEQMAALMSGAGRGAAGPPRLLAGVDGRFVFHSLVAGSYSFSATAPGYLAGGSIVSAGGRPVEIGNGERVGDVKIRLTRPAVIAGTVVDEGGDPAVGLTVQIMLRDPRGALGLGSAYDTRTDDRGSYRFGNVTPGEYLVVVPQKRTTVPTAVMDGMMQGMVSGAPSPAMFDVMSAGIGINEGGTRVGDVSIGSSWSGAPPPDANGKLIVYPTLYYPTALTAAQAASITVKSAEERNGVDLQLRLVPAVTVTGTVTGPSGPAASVGIRLIPADGSRSSIVRELDTAGALTRSDGTFTMHGVPAGQYIARVVKEGRTPLGPEAAANPLMQMMMGGNQTPTPALFGQTPLVVGTTDVTGVAIALGTGVKVSGRIEFEGVAPKPMTPQGQLQASVALQPLEGTPMMSMRGGPARPTADGTFTSGGYPAGNYRLTVTASPAWIVKSIMTGGRDLAQAPLELKDVDVSDVVITMTDKISGLSGTVRDGAAPATAATVIAITSKYRDATSASMLTSLFRIIPASKKGTYTLGGLASGDYYVVAVNDSDVGDLSSRDALEALAKFATLTTIAPGDRKTLDLTLTKVRR